MATAWDYCSPQKVKISSATANKSDPPARKAYAADVPRFCEMRFYFDTTSQLRGTRESRLYFHTLRRRLIARDERRSFFRVLAAFSASCFTLLFFPTREFHELDRDKLNTAHFSRASCPPVGSCQLRG